MAKRDFKVGEKVEVLTDLGWQPLVIFRVTGAVLECRDRWSVIHSFNVNRRDVRRPRQAA